MPEKVSMKKLKEKMGNEVVEKLFKEFPGMTIYIPKKGIEFSQEEKERYILNLYYSGYSIKKISQKLNLSEDRIRKIIYKNYNN